LAPWFLLYLLQKQILIGLLNHPGYQEQVDQLADAQQAEAHQPEGATARFAAIEAMQAVKTGQAKRYGQEGHRPQEVGQPNAAALVQQDRQNRGWRGQAMGQVGVAA
jgi:hypothetical protein